MIEFIIQDDDTYMYIYKVFRWLVASDGSLLWLAQVGNFEEYHLDTQGSKLAPSDRSRRLTIWEG